jgi:hypothetical protein
MYKIFELDKNFSVICAFKNTRSGFKHEADLLRNGASVYKTKICYLNRTWESFEYESILVKVIDECFTGKQKEKFMLTIKNRGFDHVGNNFR